MSKNICSKDLKLIYDDGKIDIDIEDVQERMKELEKIMVLRHTSRSTLIKSGREIRGFTILIYQISSKAEFC